MKHTVKCLAVLFCILLAATSNAQVGIGTTNPHASAQLEVISDSKGVLIPRMTASQRAAITGPATALLVYQTDNTPGFYFYNNGQWQRLASSTEIGNGGGNGTVANSLLNGASNPASSVGNDGDFYINTTTYILYGPKVNGAWPSTGISMVGQGNVPQAVTSAGGTIAIGNGDKAALAPMTLDLADKAVTAAKLANGAVTDAALDKVNIPLSGFGAPAGNIAMGGFKLTNLGNPTANRDAVTKKYVDDLFASSAPVLSLDAAQNLSIRGGNSVSLADLYQSLSLSGTVLSISGPRASHVDLAGILGGGGTSPGGVVIHDATLTGNGVSGSALGVANQGISALKLSGITANGTSGQLLSSNGSGGFTWVDAGSGGGGGGITGITAFGGLSSTTSGTTVSIGVNDGALALQKLAGIPTGTVLGNRSGNTSSPSAITMSDLKTMLAISKADVGLGNVQNVDQTDASNLTSGAIPAGRFGSKTIPVSAIIGNGLTDNYLRGDGTWAAIPASAGDQTAAEVPVTPNAGIVSTNVQAALEELQGKITTASNGGMTGVKHDGTLTGDGNTTDLSLADNAVTSVKVADRAITLAKLADLAGGILIGNSSPSVGGPEVISVGTGLTLAGGQLSATPVPDATTTTSGLMSPADKTKLDGLTNYTLPVASAGTLGGIKVGANLTIDGNGVLSVTGGTPGSSGGDVTLDGENYLSISGQKITAGAIDLSGTNATGILAGERFPALSGDLTTSAGSLTTSLKDIGSPGIYTKVTTDAKGRVIAGDNPTTLAGYGITDAASSAHNHALDGLSDVQVTSKASGDVLQWDDVVSKWVNRGVAATIPNVTTTAPGLMSPEDKTKLDGLNNYTLPSATATTLGGIKVGSNLSINTEGVLSADLSGTVQGNSPITASTGTKITYDEKGLVTSGEDATTADIGPSTDRNYVTDAQLAVIEQTSGVNTGDQEAKDVPVDPVKVGANNVQAALDKLNDRIDGITSGGSGGITQVLTDETLIGDGASSTTRLGLANGAVKTPKLADKAVSLIKMADIESGRLIGRSTSGTGMPEAVSIGSGLSLSGGVLSATSGNLNVAGQDYLSLSGQTLTAKPINLSGTNVTGILAGARFPALTGDVTTAEGSLVTRIGNGKVTNDMLAGGIDLSTKVTGVLPASSIPKNLDGTTINGVTPGILPGGGFSISGGSPSATLKVPSNAEVYGINTGDQTIVLSGDVTGSGTGPITATIANESITPLKLKSITASGTAGQVLTSNGSGGFAWTTPASGSISEVKGEGGVSAVTVSAATTVSLANIAARTVLGNKTGAEARPVALTGADVKDLLDLTKEDVGLANVDNTSDADKPVSNATQTELDKKLDKTARGTANGVASLDASGKVPADQIPSLNVVSVDILNNEAAMLALSGATVGSMVVRTDESKTYILKETPANNIANWVEVLTPSAAVQSVNGKTGTVVLGKNDVGLDKVENTSDMEKPVNTATLAALNGKEDKSNKSISITADAASDQMYPSVKAVKTYVDANKLPAYTGSDAGKVLTVNSGASATEWTTVNGMSAADKVKLDGIESGANNYVLPSATSSTLGGIKAGTGLSVTPDGTLNATGSGLTNIAPGTLLGNNTAGSDTPRELNSSQVKTLLGLSKADVGLGNVDNTADAEKNVRSAGQLTTAKTINGVPFDGTSDIVITTSDATKQPLHSTLTSLSEVSQFGMLAYNADGKVASRVIKGGETIEITNGNGKDGDPNVNLKRITGITAGDYTSANITVDEYGRVTRAENGAGGGGSPDLAYTSSTTNGLIKAGTGAAAEIPAGSTGSASLMLPADKSKLDKFAPVPTSGGAGRVLTVNDQGTGTEWVTPAAGGGSGSGPAKYYLNSGDSDKDVLVKAWGASQISCQWSDNVYNTMPGFIITIPEGADLLYCRINVKKSEFLSQITKLNTPYCFLKIQDQSQKTNTSLGDFYFPSINIVQYLNLIPSAVERGTVESQVTVMEVNQGDLILQLAGGQMSTAGFSIILNY